MAILKDLIVNGAARFIGDAYFNTIKAGTWNGNAISVTYGGTGLTSVASNKVLVGLGSATLTTRDIVTSVTSGSTGLVTSGAVYTALNANLASYVTLGTNLTISGEKTFNSDVLFESGAKLVMTNFNVNYTASDINNTISGTMVSHSVDSNQYSITLLSSASSSYGTQLVFDYNGFVSVPKLRVCGVDTLGRDTYQPLCLSYGLFATLNTLKDMTFTGTCVANGTFKSTGTFQTKGVNLLNSSGLAMSGKHILLGNGSYISEDSNAPANISDSYYVLGKSGASGAPGWYKGHSVVTYSANGLAPSVNGNYTGSTDEGKLQNGDYVLSSNGSGSIKWRPYLPSTSAISVTTVTGWLPGDVDGNGICDSLDLSAIMSTWLNTSNSTADVNRDGTVTITDYGILQDMVDRNNYTHDVYPIKLDTNPYTSINSDYNNSKIPVLRVNLTNYTGSLVVTLQKDGDTYIGITKHVTEGYLALFYISSSVSYGKYIPLPTQELVNSWNNKLNKLTFDTTPTANSTNPVTSGGIKTYVDSNSGVHYILNTSNCRVGRRMYITWDDLSPLWDSTTTPYVYSQKGLIFYYLCNWDDAEDSYLQLSTLPYTSNDPNDENLYYTVWTICTYNANTGEVKLATENEFCLPKNLEPFTEAEIDEILGEAEDNAAAYGSYSSY